VLHPELCPEIPSEFNLKEMRLRLGLTQIQTARLLDVSLPGWGKWERGTEKIPRCALAYFLTIASVKGKYKPNPFAPPTRYPFPELTPLVIFSPLKLERFRKELYLTQTAMAQLLYTNRLTYRAWESGVNGMPGYAWYFFLFQYKRIREKLQSQQTEQIEEDWIDE